MQTLNTDMENQMIDFRTDIDIEKVKGAFAIQDPDITAELTDFCKSTYEWKDLFVNNGVHPIQQQYKQTFYKWIKDSEHNNINGLENFNHTTITNGTSEAFAMFMMKHNTKRIRFFRGDFMMHKIASNNMEMDWEFIDAGMKNDIMVGDAIIMSCPFSDTGEEHENMQHALVRATQLNCPVLIDMAYFGMCKNINIDLNMPCIETVTFSLGKTFPLIGARAGIRFQKEIIDDPVNFANQVGIVNNLGCMIGNFAMEAWNADYIPNKYGEAYTRFCEDNDISTTKCMLFATTRDSKYESINRGNGTTRICVSDYVLDTYKKINNG